jgi:addiction module RelE/StbE family toxin
MKVKLHRVFIKHYQKRVFPDSTLDRQYRNRLELFLSNPKHPLLRDHQLVGDNRDRRAFWVTGDIRVVYKVVEGNILFYDIGTHNQVY